MSNLISRHEAIEAIEHITSSMSVCVNTDECHGMKRMQRQAVKELANLPSAHPEPSQVARDIATIIENEKDMRVVLRNSEQTEIIYCKDCKWKQGSECVMFADVRPFPDDFCSRAERKEDE